jgi:hypothetical protein
MPARTKSLPLPAPAQETGPLDLEALQRAVATNKTFALCIIFGLPALGLLAALVCEIPLFAALVASGFLFGTGLVCHKAVSTFTGMLLRVLVTARLVIVLVVAGLLFFGSGCVWAGLVSALLLWLTADRLLGRRALYDLYKLTRGSR